MSVVRILFIEDQELDVQNVLAHLRHQGYSIYYERVNKPDVLDMALQREWDLVLLDYSLPGWNVLDALARVRQTQPYLTVIVLSGVVDEARMAELMKPGLAQDCVEKTHLARLIPVIERELPIQRMCLRQVQAFLKVA